MSKVQLTFACPAYDRVQALRDGTVTPEGIDLNCLNLESEEVFWRQLRHREFDISETSLSSYTLTRSRGDNSFIAIPVFISRFFRHSCIFVNVNKGIKQPEDLKGRIVGIPEYQMTATVWIRGFLQDEFGVYPRDLNWRSGGEEQPGRVDKIPVALSPEVHLERIPPDKTLARMLDDGEIDALITARAPSCFVQGSSNVARLFPNYRELEEDYFQRTGIFPIMHTVIIKREAYEPNPWIAMSLYKAFCQAKDIALHAYTETGVLHAALPWLVPEIERIRRVMGDDWWPYGVQANIKTLETFFRYHHEQGLSARLMTVRDIFASETLDEFKI